MLQFVCLTEKLRGKHLTMMVPLKDMTVLVAEDERSVRMLLRVVLEAAGARVLCADDGMVAMRLFELHPEIDVVCTDVGMPRMGGVELTRALRARDAGLPIVACTALDLRGHAKELRSLVDAHVHKPFSPADLVRALRDAADARARSPHSAVS